MQNIKKVSVLALGLLICGQGGLLAGPNNNKKSYKLNNPSDKKSFFNTIISFFKKKPSKKVVPVEIEMYDKKTNNVSFSNANNTDKNTSLCNSYYSRIKLLINNARKEELEANMRFIDAFRKAKVPVNKKNKYGVTPNQLALVCKLFEGTDSKKRAQIINMSKWNFQNWSLFKNKKLDEFGNTALHLACHAAITNPSTQNYELIQLLVNKVADCNATNNAGKSYNSSLRQNVIDALNDRRFQELVSLIAQGNPEKVKNFLLSNIKNHETAKTIINWCDEQKNNALHYAYFYKYAYNNTKNYAQIIEYLGKLGGDLTAENSNNLTPPQLDLLELSKKEEIEKEIDDKMANEIKEKKKQQEELQGYKYNDRFCNSAVKPKGDNYSPRGGGYCRNRIRLYGMLNLI